MYLQTVCFNECFIDTSQQYGRSPVYTPICTFRLYALQIILLHPSQQYRCSPVCTPLCTFRLYALLNVLLTHHSNMDAPQLQTVCFTECFISTSQQYGRSPVCTPLCTFRLYALLNVLLTHHSNMGTPQHVHPYVPSDCMLY